MYQRIAGTDCILRLDDGVILPPDARNMEYVAYLAWLAQDNTPEPAYVPGPKVVAQEQIDALERREQAPRFVRESLLEVAVYLAETKGAAVGLSKAQALALLAAKNLGYVRLKALDDEIAALRSIVKGAP